VKKTETVDLWTVSAWMCRGLCEVSLHSAAY